MKPYLWLLIAFISSGLIRIVVKLGSNFDPLSFITVSYFIGFLFALIVRKKAKRRLTKKVAGRSILFGLIIGLINFFSFFLQLNALSIGQASVIFPLTSLSVYVAVVLSILVFREKVSLKKSLGILFSIIAILLLGS